MILKTQVFGEIEIDESKKLVFEQGIIGYPDYKTFFLLYDIEKEGKTAISWLQSAEDECFALPVINPLLVDESYNPVVEDEILTSLGDAEDEFAVFTTIRVPEDITKMTMNQMAPIIVNIKTQKCCQIIVENQGYEVRMPIYDILKRKKEEK